MNVVDGESDPTPREPMRAAGDADADRKPRADAEKGARSAGDDAEMPGDQRVLMHVAALRAYVRLRLGRSLRAREESADIAQSVVREALEDVGRFHGGDPQMRAWILKRAENKIRDRVRFWNRDRRTAEREVESTDDDGGVMDIAGSLLTPSRIVSSREELSNLERAFAELDDDHRRVILLARIAGLSHAEVAREMDRSEQATRTLLSRALARLAMSLERGGTKRSGPELTP